MERMRARTLAEESDECIQPAEAFAIVGNETRLNILEALWDADEEKVSFSDLHEAIGIYDSAQFNYHLNRLTGDYVRKTNEGYELRTAGKKVIRAIVAGSFNAHPRLEPFETGDGCTQCGDPLVASYEDEMLSVECRTCGYGHGKYSFPPGGLQNRTNEEVLDAFDHRTRHFHCLAKDGVCPECGGPTTATVVREGSCCLGTDLSVEYVCGHCEHSLCSTVGLSLLDQSPVISFYRDHGIDLGSKRYWQLEWCVSDDPVTVQSKSPWSIDVEITLGDEKLRVTLDGDMNVVESQRAKGVAEVN